MDNAVANTITITPTPEVFMAGSLMVRAWVGETRDGVDVTALVASVSLRGHEPIPGLTPIPPPEPDWDPRVREAVGRIWRIAAKLLPEEADGLACVMERLTGGKLDVKARQAAASSFLTYAKLCE